MLMKFGQIALILLTLTATAHAEIVVCPDLTSAVQVATCPSEDELRYTFTGFCSDNARIYNWQEEQVCTDYPLYRRLKNVALWEASGGKFYGYPSCELPREQVMAAKPVKITVAAKGGLTRVICGYTADIVFAYRTRAQCRVEGGDACATALAACKAICD